MGKEAYNDLIFQLGDLARERLAEKAPPLESMAYVFETEDALVALQDEVKALEDEMNQEDADYQGFTADTDDERAEQQAVVAKWKKAVDSVEGRSRELRKKISSSKATLRYEKSGLRTSELKHKDFELREAHNPSKVEVSLQNLKKFRLQIMRKQRDIEELERELGQVLTARPGQPGGQGITAYKRLLELEDEVEQRKADHEQKMAELDEAIAARDEDVKAAEEAYDEALFALGEECHQKRVNDVQLAALYPKIDKAR